MNNKSYLAYIIKRLLVRLEKRINWHKSGVASAEEEAIMEMARTAIEEIDREVIRSLSKNDKTWRELH